MGKFKVGDRVRRIGTFNCDDMRIGDTGTVTEVDAAGDCRVKPDKGGDVQFNFARYLELVTAAPAPWQPKVGDRVRFTDAVPSHWFFGPTKEHKEGVIRSDSEESGGFRFTVNVGNSYGYVNLGHIEPAPLIITADRYYKTRDGRKVGPVVVAQGPDDPWPWKLASGTHYYRNDGFSCPGWADGHRAVDDLIAEWVDDPAVIANDNAAPAKFKVGDRVRALVKWCDVEIGDILPVIGISGGGVWATDKLGDNTFMSLDEIELAAEQVVATTPAIVALIESGKPKPATRPVVHASQEAATTEAGRLALAHPGQEFGVFVLADSKIADVVEEVVKKTILRAA